MYINPFLLGVIVTLLVVTLVIIAASLLIGRKK